MTYRTLLIDRRPVFLNAAEATASVLTLPLGGGTVLSALLPRLREADAKDIIILPTFATDKAYIERIQTEAGTPVTVVTRDELNRLLDASESADYMIVVEASHWPQQGHGFADSIRRNADYRGATHLIAVGSNADETRESVECDHSGLVTRVQRLYKSMSWPDAMDDTVCYTLVPARMLTGVQFGSLGELRTALVGRRVLSQDVPLTADVTDLANERELLELNQKVVASLARWPGSTRAGESSMGVMVDSSATVAPTARLISPVVVGKGAVIEDNATVVGPSVVGAEARIGSGAVVAQSVIGHGASVAAGATTRHRIILSHLSPTGPVPPPTNVFQGLFAQGAATCDQCENSETTGGVEGACTGCLTSENGPTLATRLLMAARPTLPGRRRKLAHLAVKRFMDIVLSTAAMLVLSPLLAMVAIVVKLDSSGPIFFRHRREGRGGREFGCVKFRTMVSDAHTLQRQLYAVNEVDGPQFKLRHDPRITRAGRWLRATNLDELPQLVNVLLGHMSLVGPRPSPFRENQICVPWRRARLSVRPGITGLWQVCRSEDRSGGDFHEWIFFDLAYVRAFSVWLDVKILAATVLTLGGRYSVDPAWMVPASLPTRSLAPSATV